MKLTANKIVSEILHWFQRNRRELPWRKTQNPYRILLSEIMLQQTQVSRVKKKYPEFLKRFPTLKALANSSRGEVIRAWSGMGYNNRALRLREVARIIVERFNGKLPNSVEILQQLPGLGRYTANAVRCFAHGDPVPIVDTNVHRLLTRIFWRATDSTYRQDSGKIWRLAGDLLPKNRAADWNLALMDLGATICRASAPRCHECPIQRLCRSAFRIKRNRNLTLRHEPVYQGRPRRYYRGRIVEALRNANHDGWISLRMLGRQIKSDFNVTELRWLRGLLRQLELDGLIVIRSETKPAGMHVHLA